MLKKSITFEDLDGNEVTEDFYFNLSTAEIVEMEQSHGGLTQHLQSVIDGGKGDAIYAAIKMVIQKTVGCRSEDGKRFNKSPEVVQAFMETDAYSVLLAEFLMDTGAFTEFMLGVLPNKVSSKIDLSAITNAGLPVPALVPEIVEIVTEEGRGVHGAGAL